MGKKIGIYMVIPLLVFQFSNALAQTNKTRKILAYPSNEKKVPLKGVVDLANVKSNFEPVLQSLEIEDQNNAGVSAYRPPLKPRQPGSFQSDGTKYFKTTTAPTPVIYSLFTGSNDNAYTPPDDNIAVSNQGYVISAINSLYRIFKPNSSIIYKTFNFKDALKQQLPAITGVYYDPRVIYDPQSNRFIIVVLNGITSSTSNIVVMFSKDSNPVDGWNAYAISGDIFNNSEWADYDNISISKDDLFITDNLFTDNQNFAETSVLQINKNTGYNGDSLAYRSWQPTSADLISLVPVNHAYGGNYGDTMYFVSNKIRGGTTVTLLELTGNESSTTSSLSTSVIDYKTLYVSSPTPTGGAQKNSTYTLNEGDTRIKQAFYFNRIIHYVFSTSDPSTGFSDIVYSRLNVDSNIVNYKLFGLENFDYVYPSIAVLDTTATCNSVLIGYCRSGKSIYPEVDVVACDSNFNFSSSTIIHLGLSSIKTTTTQTQRWGDYTGMARQYNSNYCYFSGSYGSGSAYVTEIAKVGLKKSGIDEKLIPAASDITVFPNPVTDIYTLKFEMERKCRLNISVTDMQGRQVELLFDGYVLAGKETFSFNKAALRPGIYTLVLTSDSSAPVSKKIIVAGR